MSTPSFRYAVEADVPMLGYAFQDEWARHKGSVLEGFTAASREAKALLAESVADDVGAIGPYIAPVQVDADGKIEPGNLREQIRRTGVTIGQSAQV